MAVKTELRWTLITSVRFHFLGQLFKSTQQSQHALCLTHCSGLFCSQTRIVNSDCFLCVCDCVFVHGKSWCWNYTINEKENPTIHKKRIIKLQESGDRANWYTNPSSKLLNPEQLLNSRSYKFFGLCCIKTFLSISINKLPFLSWWLDMAVKTQMWSEA